MFAWFKKWFPRKLKVASLPEPVIYPEEHTVGPELPQAHDKGQLKLGIIVGHTKESPGAKMAPPYTHTEYEYNKNVAFLIESLAIEEYKQITVEVIYRDYIGIAGAYAKAKASHCDAVIELHFNALNGKTTGTMTLCTVDNTDVEFAHIIHSSICSALKRKDASLGVRTVSQSGRGGANIYSFPGGVNCLVEPFFGDVKQDAELGITLQSVYAKAIIQGVLLWGRKADLLR